MPIRYADIRSIPLFRKIQEGDTPLLLQYFEEHEIPSGTYLSEPGKLQDTLYVLINGEIQIRNQHRPTTTLTAGGFFGSNHILHPQLASCSAQAQGHCHILSLSNIDLRNMIDQSPSIAADILLQIAEHSAPVPTPNPAAFEKDLEDPVRHHFENSPGINRSQA